LWEAKYPCIGLNALKKCSKTNDVTLELIMGLNFITREWISFVPFLHQEKGPSL
jgi:hypothetical protein